jgi:hypothetical protein
MSFRIVPIGPDVADYVRAHHRAPGYGHPATVEIASGSGPCRQCLRVFRQGQEARILFTLNAGSDAQSLPQPGPVFIHEEPCTPFDGEGVPQDFHDLPLFLEAVGRGSWMVRRVPIEPGRAAEAIHGLLADPETEHVNIRNAEAGCFVARVVRR